MREMIFDIDPDTTSRAEMLIQFQNAEWLELWINLAQDITNGLTQQQRARILDAVKLHYKLRVMAVDDMLNNLKDTAE